MRTLSNNEINNVAGAGYNEDIITAAASIYVGSAIGGAASGISSAAFAGTASLIGAFSGFAPLASAVGTVGMLVSPVVFVAAPVLAFSAVYPGVITEKVGAYFN